MRETLITRHDDSAGDGEFDSIAWLYSEHLKTPDTRIFNSAILYGNEDSPEMVDLYRRESPLITDKAHRIVIA